jgi:hypothetical protein
MEWRVYHFMELKLTVAVHEIILLFRMGEHVHDISHSDTKETGILE